MTSERYCQKHGPYEAQYAECPYCARESGRPAPPNPLNEDEMVTDLGDSPGGSSGGAEGPTEVDGPEYNEFPGIDPTEIDSYIEKFDVTEIDIVDTETKGFLIVKEGKRRGQTFNLKDGSVVGRKKGDVVLSSDPKVSNPHAKFRLENEKFVIWDFGTSNGTFVNGERIRAATELEENNLIRIGDTVFVLKVLE